jgi:hypothetical protein
MSKRLLRVVVWLCLIVLPLQGWGHVGVGLCASGAARSDLAHPGHLVAAPLSMRAVSARAPIPMHMGERYLTPMQASVPAHDRAGAARTDTASASPAAHLPSGARHHNAVPACALCAVCAACFASMLPNPSTEPGHALLMLYYRAGIAPRSAYTSAPAEVPHPPPRTAQA